MVADDICFLCSVGITHTCLICQAVVQGSGNAPCYPCSKRRWSEHQIDEEAATIPIRWISGMFIAFCRGRIPLDDDIASERIARAAEACRAIAARDPAYGRIYTLPMARVLSLRDNEVTVTKTSVTLWPTSDSIAFEEALVAAFRRWADWYMGYASPPNPWCFRGRYGHQLLSKAAVAYYRKPDTKGKPPKF